MDDPKFAHIVVRLTGQDGNTGAIMGSITTAMKQGGVDATEISAFRAAIFDCGSYDDVLRLAMRTVTIV